MKLDAYEIENSLKIQSGLHECMVLLKSNGAFPLKKAGTLAAYGNGIRHSIKGGTGSGEVNSRYVINIEQGLKEAGFQIISDDWLDSYDLKKKQQRHENKRYLKQEAKKAGIFYLIYAMGHVAPEFNYDLPLRFDGDAAIYVVSRMCGEGNDRKVIEGDFLLTKTEIRDILDLNEKYKHFMLVINTGGPIDLSPVKEVGNILYISQLGVNMGTALSNVLLGIDNPSGKLTTTWASFDSYCPDIHFGDAQETYYNEGIYVGYRYFNTVNKKPLFPFGYGTSYTQFQIENINVTMDQTKVQIECTVENTGLYKGKEVVQVYVSEPEGILDKPYQKLAAFIKTFELEPNEKEDVFMEFDFSELESFDEQKHAYILEKGDYIIRVGNSSENTCAICAIQLDQMVITRKVRSIVEPCQTKENSYKRCVENSNELPVIPLSSDLFCTRNVQYDKAIEVDPLIHRLSDDELIYLCVGDFRRFGGIVSVIGSASSHVAGAAGESTSRLKDKGIQPIIMADGPAGLRLSRHYYEDHKGRHTIGDSIIPVSVLEYMSEPLKWIVNTFLGTKKVKEGLLIHHQYCTTLPIETAIAQSWNVDYAQLCGDVVGDEMERFGIHLWLAPALNIHRSVLCGRNYEYYSEDPVLSGKMAAAVTKGVQKHKGRATTIKHFAGNNQEFNRYGNNSQMSERTLRELYLKGFEICIKESQPLAVMTSYNLINGVHTSESRGLIEDYLRMETQFKGLVVTDWIVGQIPTLGEHRTSVADCVAKAGGDLFMPGCTKDFKAIQKALKKNEISRHQLELNATRVYQLSKKVNK